MSSSDSVAVAASPQPPNPALNPPPFIYRIVTRAEWQDTFERNGRYCGSPLDQKDGFIHISSKEETAKTAALYYANQKDILLLQLDVAQVRTMHSAHQRAARCTCVRDTCAPMDPIGPLMCMIARVVYVCVLVAVASEW